VVRAPETGPAAGLVRPAGVLGSEGTARIG